MKAQSEKKILHTYISSWIFKSPINIFISSKHIQHLISEPIIILPDEKGISYVVLKEVTATGTL
jgi:hypothetical protein